MVGFLQDILHRKLTLRVLPKEHIWDVLQSFTFFGEGLMDEDQFTFKSNFRDRALSAVKEQNDVEKK